MRFSERMGYREIKYVIQTESIDEPLRNSLWNAIWNFYYSKFSIKYYSEYYSETDLNALKDLNIKIWTDFLKEPVDELNFDGTEPVDELRDDYFFWCEYRVV